MPRWGGAPEEARGGRADDDQGVTVHGSPPGGLAALASATPGSPGDTAAIPKIKASELAPVMDGGRKAIQRVVRRHTGQLEACYERTLQVSPSLHGRIVVEWTIAPDGRVTDAKILSSTMRSPKVGECIVEAIQRWRFPRSEGGDRTIRYPFLFRPGA